jgi:hypothetical protein
MKLKLMTLGCSVGATHALPECRSCLKSNLARRSGRFNRFLQIIIYWTSVIYFNRFGYLSRDLEKERCGKQPIALPHRNS